MEVNPNTAERPADPAIRSVRKPAPRLPIRPPREARSAEELEEAMETTTVPARYGEEITVSDVLPSAPRVSTDEKTTKVATSVTTQTSRG